MKKITGVLSALLGAGLVASLTVNYCFYRKLSTPDPHLSQQVRRGRKTHKYNKQATQKTVALAELLARQKKKPEKAQPKSDAIITESRFQSCTRVKIYLNDSVSGESLTPVNLSKDFVRIVPDLPFTLDTGYSGFYIEAEFEPEKNYSFLIDKGIVCENGRELKESAEIRLKSPAMPTRLQVLTSGLIFPDKRSNRTLPLQVSNTDTIKVSVIRLYENNLGRFRIRQEYWSDSIEALEYGKTVAEKQIELKLPRNREVNYPLDLNRLIPPGETGIYGLVLLPQSGKNVKGQQKMAVVSVTDLAPQVVIDKFSKNAFAVVRRLSDSSPCANAEVTLISRKFQTLATGKTDAEGIVRLDYGKSSAGSDPGDAPDALLVKLGRDLVYVRDLHVKSHSLAEFGTAGNQNQTTPRALVYTERGVYRPGEKVCVTAWIRNSDLSVYANAPCKLNVRDANSNTIFSFPGKTDAGGLVHTEFTIPATSRGGSMEVLCLPADGTETAWGKADFLAADFMPDRIKVRIKPDQTVLLGADAPANFTFSAEYYFGGKLKDSTYRFAVRATPAPKPAEWKDWTVGSSEFTPGRTFSARGSINDGEVMQNYPGFVWTGGKAGKPILLCASASVSDPGGRAVTANTSVVCHPTPFYLGLQSGSDRENVVFNWKFFPAERNSVQPMPKDLKIRLVFTRREWKYVLKKSDSGLSREWVRENVPAGEAEIAVGDLASGTFRHKLDNGSYTVTATCGEIRTDMEFWHWYGEGGARSSNPSVISCKLDKETYLPGETAAFTLESPADGAALITLGDRKLSSCRSFPVKAGSNTLKVVLPADADTSACYAGITLVAGENRQFGLVRISLDQARHRLKVAIRAQETAVPQEKIKVGISLASPDGKPQKGMVQLFAVDEGILALTRYKTPDIFRHFYGAYECDFLFCDIYAILYPDLKIDKDGKIGGGEAEGSSLERPDMDRDPRRAAPESAVRVLPPFPVDGSAEVEIALPDHLGAMRLMAVASAPDRAGSADAELKIRDKIDLMTTAPQVCAPGDETTVTFTMFNHDQPAGKMELSLDIPGKPAEVRVVGKGQNQSLKTQVRIPDKEGLYTFTATLKKDALVKKKTVKIPVRLPNPKITASYLRMLKPGEKWTPGKDIPQFAPDARHQLSAAVSNRAAIADALAWLNDYPYGCLEQTTSAAFPFLSTDALLECGVISKEMAAVAKAKKDRAAGKLLSMMLHNGAFPMWHGGTEAWPGGTVFAAHFLTAGNYLTDGPQKRLLVNYLKSLAQDASAARYERAYACYVLAASGDKSMTTVTCARNLLNGRKDDYASFLAAAALLEGGYSGESWSRLRTLLAKEVWRNAGELPYFMRDAAVTGMTLYILMKVEADAPEAIAKLRQQLTGSLKSDGSGWGVTHSNAWAVLGLAELERRLPKGKGSALVTDANGKQIRPDLEKNEPVLLSAAGCTVENTGDAPLFVQYKVTGVPVKAEPVRTAIRLSRTFLRDGKKVTSARQGDLLTVRLELDCKCEVNDLVISDLLPGGLEIEDERFATRAQGVPAAKQKLKNFLVKHEEKRPGEFVLSGTVTEPGKIVVTYQARAVSRGRYALGSSSAEAMYDPELRAFEPGSGSFEVK